MSMPDSFRYLVASDWSECLSPNGPFDALIHTWPDLEPELTRIFSAYTSNAISLSSAVEQIKILMPGELSAEAMDAFLKEQFAAYANLSGLIRQCLEHGIAFMINSTGPIGYFQRALAGGFVPEIPLLSAHPFLRYSPSPTDPDHVFELLEIEDKGTNTQAALNTLGIPPHRVAVVGDSGGDGPHFAWAAENKALRIAVNPKASLERYCAERGIAIHARAGIAYRQGQPRDPEAEAKTDLNEVLDILLRELPA